MAVAKKETVKKTTKESTSEELFKKQAQELQELKEQMALMMKVQNNPVPQKEFIDVERDVFVVSLVRGRLNLATKGDGAGFIYKFEHFGEETPVKYSDLKLIVQNNRKMLNKGRFYIYDEDFIKQQRLKQTFDKILSKEEMEKLYSAKKEVFIKAFNKMIPAQQGMFTALLIDALREGNDIDANIVQVVSEKIDRNIYDMVKESKLYATLKGE